MSATIPDYSQLTFPGYRSFLTKIGPLAADYYALTMTYALWQLGEVDKTGTSHVFCRSLINNGQRYGDGQPVKVPYLINSGLGLFAEWLDGWKYSDEDLATLAQQRITPPGAKRDQQYFSNEFLFWLSKQELTLQIDAMPEGELILPHQPSLRLSGPVWQHWQLEGMALNLLSSHTNQTTFNTQIRLAAMREGKPTLAVSAITGLPHESALLAEMGLRRGPGLAGLVGSRAALMAGWNASSNMLMAKYYGGKIIGTFAHAWVLLYETESEAFEKWARVNPHATIFLADTYDTLDGVREAIAICKKHQLNLKGIRLDSGNLGHLSRETQKLLDTAGYPEALILGSDGLDLDKTISLYHRATRDHNNQLSSALNSLGIGGEAQINRYQPQLDFVMKLAAVNDREGLARAVMKFSEIREKSTFPGALDVIRTLAPATSPSALPQQFGGDILIPHGLEVGEGTLSRELVSHNLRVAGQTLPFLAGTPFYRPIQAWRACSGTYHDAAYAAADPARILREATTRTTRTLAMLEASHRTLTMPHFYDGGVAAELMATRNEAWDAQKLSRARAHQATRFGLTA